MSAAREQAQPHGPSFEPRVVCHEQKNVMGVGDASSTRRAKPWHAPKDHLANLSGFSRPSH
eukprot:7381445-Prymnesium_polylepis.1